MSASANTRRLPAVPDLADQALLAGLIPFALYHLGLAVFSLLAATLLLGALLARARSASPDPAERSTT